MPFFVVLGVFGDAVSLFSIDLIGVAGLDFRDADGFASCESIAFNMASNCGVNAFGTYNVLAENLFKFVPCPSGAAFASLVGVDLVVNDDEFGVDGADSAGVGGNVGPDEFLIFNELELVDV